LRKKIVKNMDTPQFIGEYEVISLLGEGGVSKVFQARKQGAFGFSKTYAIKLFHAKNQKNKEHFQSSFVSEAKVLSFLNHPHIVQVHDLCSHDDDIYVVMDFIDGLTLDGLLKKINSPLSHDIALAITQDILLALDFMQEFELGQKKISIVHGDISLQNIMVQKKTFHSKLNDFGFSRAIPFSKSARITPPVIGNPYYISPEHMRSEWIDTRSDIYSLGIVLYDLLFNERLFYYDLSEIKNLAKRGQTINRDNFIKLPPEIAKIITKMTAINPEHRYQSPQEILTEIENYQVKNHDHTPARKQKEAFLKLCLY
jgi:serine/threonine protein kinase